MSSVQSALSAQLLDRAAEAVNGPVLGVVTATSTVDGTPINRGQLGTLPDGRVVRCVKGVRVYSIGSPVLVRLMHLSPTVPAKGNFLPVTAGTVVTWGSTLVDSGALNVVPTGIVATGTVAANFAPDTGAALSALVEFEQLGVDADAFSSGAQGDTAAIIMPPDAALLSGMGSGHAGRHAVIQTSWTIRVNVSGLSSSALRSTRSKEAFDALFNAIHGSRIGSGPAWFTSWKLAKPSGAVSSWEFKFTTKHVGRGHPLQAWPALAAPPALGPVGVVIPFNVTGQTPAEQIAADIAIPTS